MEEVRFVFWDEEPNPDLATDTQQIEKEFELPGALTGAVLRFAAYTGYDMWADYEMHTLVIFERDGKLWEVNAAHCSCYGLEDQWEPEETSWAAIAMRELSSPEVVKDALKRICEERGAS